MVLAHSATAFIDEDGTVTNAERYPLQTDSGDVTTRFRSLLYTQGRNSIYGVIRMSVMRAVQPHGSHHNADRTVVADLALNGRFHQVDEALYFRRDHPGRAERAASGLRRRTAHLDPSRANRWAHPAVRLVAEYLASYVTSVARAPISRRDRLRCLGALALWVARHANPLRRRHLLDSPGSGGPGDRGPLGCGPGAPAGARAAAGQQSAGPAQVRRPALYGFIGSGNLGNDASFEVALSWLRSLPGSIDPLCITLAPEQVRRRYGIDALALRLGEPGDGPRVNPAGTRSVARAVVRGARRLLDGPRSLWLVSRVDAVIVPGMGVLEESSGCGPGACRSGCSPWRCPADCCAAGSCCSAWAPSRSTIR